MAGSGYKLYATGDILTAAQVNNYLQEQTVMVFADAAARTTALSGVVAEGMFSYLKDTNATQYYDGSAWTNLDTTGMVNPMTTTGDTIYSSSGTTPARLGIGTTGQVLTVASGLPSWATPSTGSIVYVGGTTFSASSAVNVNNVFSATYANYLVVADYVGSSATAGMTLRLRVSGADNTTSNYNHQVLSAASTSISGSRATAQTSMAFVDSSTSPNFAQVSVINPFATANTMVGGYGIFNGGTGIEIQNKMGSFTATTSFTGFSLIPSAGTLTGTVRVYGLVNS
jgi:hypothetical protein